MLNTIDISDVGFALVLETRSGLSRRLFGVTWIRLVLAVLPALAACGDGSGSDAGANTFGGTETTSTSSVDGNATSNSATGALTIDGNTSMPGMDSTGDATSGSSDDAGAYSLPAMDAATCSDCYQLRVTAAAGRPATHWDATVTETLDGQAAHEWILHIGHSFTDVDAASPFYPAIETLVHYEVTLGCAADEYCPVDTVTRGQAAAFIARSMSGGPAAVPNAGNVPGAGAYDCAGGVSVFDDVSPNDAFCPDVHFLAANDITSGCGASTFCPADPTLRWQFAVFVAAGMAGGIGSIPSSYVDPTSGRSYDCGAGDVHFADVAAGAPYCAATHYLWAREVVNGCGTDTFCPVDDLTREHAAVFVVNGFDLQLYGP